VGGGDLASTTASVSSSNAASSSPVAGLMQRIVVMVGSCSGEDGEGVLDAALESGQPLGGHCTVQHAMVGGEGDRHDRGDGDFAVG
jgi:hypothetical protein